MSLSEHNFIDIHTHVLPGLDDGSSNMEMTVEILKAELDQGIKTIIATPHFDCETSYNANKVSELVLEVQEEAKKLDPELKIYSGNELFFEDGILDVLKQKKACTLANSRYVLVEFSIDESYKRMYSGMQEFIIGGYIPVIAHMERYSCLWKKKDRIEELIQLGCYMQVNAGSFIGGFLNGEASYLKKIASEGLIHFIASDTHNLKERKPIMEDCLKHLRKPLSESILERMTYLNPKKVIENKYI